MDTHFEMYLSLTQLVTRLIYGVVYSVQINIKCALHPKISDISIFKSEIQKPNFFVWPIVSVKK